MTHRPLSLCLLPPRLLLRQADESRTGQFLSAAAKGQADRVTSDDVIASLLDAVPVESTDPATAKGLDRTVPVQ